MKKLSDGLLNELRDTFKEDYGQNLTIEETASITRTFVRYFEILAELNGKNMDDVPKTENKEYNLAGEQHE